MYLTETEDESTPTSLQDDHDLSILLRSALPRYLFIPRLLDWLAPQEQDDEERDVRRDNEDHQCPNRVSQTMKLCQS